MELIVIRVVNIVGVLSDLVVPFYHVRVTRMVGKRDSEPRDRKPSRKRTKQAKIFMQGSLFSLAWPDLIVVAPRPEFPLKLLVFGFTP